MRDRIHVLSNTVQPYAWGSETAIPRLLGQAPQKGVSQAELWMGAHPKAPSRLKWEDRWLDLDRAIRMDPAGILGPVVAQRFNDTLPFLFKVLAAAEPLSIQAHPNKVQAGEGYRLENERGVDLAAPNRNYKDANHKPECLCALTPFWALCGFRPAADIIAYAERLGLPGLQDVFSVLAQHPPAEGYRAFFRRLMRLDTTQKLAVINDLRTRAESLSDSDPVFRWIERLIQAYPQDIGVLSPVYLNLFCLQPGEAVFLTAGVLHAYLEGVGIELMANSDNVLRGGLTPKHVDEAELLRVVDFKHQEANVLPSPPNGAREHVYVCPVDEFVLFYTVVAEGRAYRQHSRQTVEIMLCTQGGGRIRTIGGQQIESFQQGSVLLIPAGVSGYEIDGQATLFRATVPTAQGT